MLMSHNKCSTFCGTRNTNNDLVHLKADDESQMRALRETRIQH